MSDWKDSIDQIEAMSSRLAEQLKFTPPSIPYVDILPQIPTVEIDEESTFAYQMQQQTNQIIEKSNEQIRLLNEHNEQLTSNYKKLEELYNLKAKELDEAKRDAKKAKRYNTAMMIITIISMLVAVAAWLLPNILGGAS
jgi:hypothetical protein